MEMNFGDWEGKKWNQIDQIQLNTWMLDFVNVETPNGENLLNLFRRVSSILDELRNNPAQKVLLITHAGVIRCIFAYILDIPLHNLFKIPVEYQGILRFQLGKTPIEDSIKQMM